MGDVSSELSDLIAKSTVFGNSDNIRVGRYKFVIKRTFADKFDSGRYAIAEFKVLEALANPQVMPAGVTAAQFDDGTKPNLPGSTCAMKINFDGNGAKSAPGNVKAYVLGLFGMNQADTPETEVNQMWKDLARLKDNLNNDGTPAPGKRGNPSCGMVITCIASMKEKRSTKALPPEQKGYVTVCTWECASKLGTGENTAELVAARRAEIESSTAEDDDEVIAAAPALPVAAAPVAAIAAPLPPAPAIPVAPPIPAAAFVPPAPWVIHPNAAKGNTPDTIWYWDGGAGVKNLATLQAGG